MSPVVAQEMAVEEFIGILLGSTGKDRVRLRDLLLRGTFVSGASRFRWQGLEVGDQELAVLLARFPDSDPNRLFDPALCTRLIIRGRKGSIILESKDARRRRFFCRRSLWDELIRLMDSPEYVEYSYKERADRYRLHLNEDARRRVREAARLSPFSTIVRQIESSSLDSIDAYVGR